MGATVRHTSSIRAGGGELGGDAGSTFGQDIGVPSLGQRAERLCEVDVGLTRG